MKDSGFKIFNEIATGYIVIKENSQYNKVDADYVVIEKKHHRKTIW